MKFSKDEIEAVIAAAPRMMVPYNKLVLSADYQVRPADSSSKMTIQELAASIKAMGVMHNLIVVKGPRGMYHVCAGGRRLEALGLLVSNGDFPENYPVAVMVVPAEKALMASLIENIERVALDAVDQLHAFARLIAEGRTVEDVAAVFGVAPLVVKRRLKLAAVSPQLLALFRTKEIDLECLMVLASVDEHERQEQAWASLPAYHHNAEQLRQLLTRGEIESDVDAVARFVTLKAYEKAGGALRRDLFCDDPNKAYLLDAVLLDKLALDKLQKTAKPLAAAGWKWVDVRTRYVYDEYVKYGELRKTPREANEQEAAEIDALQAQVDERHHRMEELCDTDGDEDKYYKLEAEADALTAQIQEMEDRMCEWSADLMAQAGCVVYVNRQAKVDIKFGLIRPEDRHDMAAAAKQANERADREHAQISLPSSKPKVRPVHSEKLMRRLTAHRVAAVQAELIDRPDVALAVLTAHLVQKLLQTSDYRTEAMLAVTATDSEHALRGAADDMEDSAAWGRVDAARTMWGDRLPGDPSAVLPWLLTQDTATVLELLAALVALTVTGIYGVEPEKQSTDALADALGLDMTQWWRATGTAYFEHVSKARIVEVVTEAKDLSTAKVIGDMKKDAAVAAAERAVTGTGWLPRVLRTGVEGTDPAGSDEMPEDEVADVSECQDEAALA